MNELLKLLAELKDSNEHILTLTPGTRTPTDDEIGLINSHACDVAFFANRIQIAIEMASKAEAK